VYFVHSGVYDVAYRDKKVVGVFVPFSCVFFVVKLHGVNHEVFYFLMFRFREFAFNFGYTLLPYVLVVE
jgi:hypothetical protein